jgi:hypothetical protein
MAIYSNATMVVDDTARFVGNNSALYFASTSDLAAATIPTVFQFVVVKMSNTKSVICNRMPNSTPISATVFASSDGAKWSVASTAPTDLGTMAAKSNVAIADITASGTANNTTFLRGDGAWGTIVQQTISTAAASTSVIDLANLRDVSIDLIDLFPASSVNPATEYANWQFAIRFSDGTWSTARDIVVDPTIPNATQAGDILTGGACQARIDLVAGRASKLHVAHVSHSPNLLLEGLAVPTSSSRAWSTSAEVSITGFRINTPVPMMGTIRVSATRA